MVLSFNYYKYGTVTFLVFFYQFSYDEGTDIGIYLLKNIKSFKSGAIMLNIRISTQFVLIFLKKLSYITDNT